jgi:hypothetical protein
LGEYCSRTSKGEYGRVIQDWEAAGRRLVDEPVVDLNVNEILTRFCERTEQHDQHPQASSPTISTPLGDSNLSTVVGEFGLAGERNAAIGTGSQVCCSGGCRGGCFGGVGALRLPAAGVETGVS